MYISPLNFYKRAEKWFFKHVQSNFLESIAGAVVGGLFSNRAAKKAAASQDAAAQLAYEQSLPWGVRGPLGTAEFDEETREAVLALDPEMQALYDRMYGRAGQYGEQIEALDPTALQQKFYEEQRGLFAPQEEQERLALEKRLVSQGMFGSTGGAGQMEALLKAQQLKDLARQSEAFDKAQQVQDLYRARETADIAQALGIAALPYDYATLGRGIGSGMSSAAQYGAGLRSQGALNVADTQSAFWGKLGQTIGQQQGLFGTSFPTFGTQTTGSSWGGLAYGQAPMPGFTLEG